MHSVGSSCLYRSGARVGHDYVLHVIVQMSVVASFVEGPLGKVVFALASHDPPGLY